MRTENIKTIMKKKSRFPIARNNLEPVIALAAYLLLLTLLATAALF
jgi:hypothetical protein